MGLHHVVTLLLDDCVLLDVAIPVHVFGYHGNGRYRLTLAGHHRGPVRTSTGVVLQAEAGLRALSTADTVVVPGYVENARVCPSSAPILLLAAASLWTLSVAEDERAKEEALLSWPATANRWALWRGDLEVAVLDVWPGVAERPGLDAREA